MGQDAMKVNTPQRISAWERRKAAIHEAGHAVVGFSFGLAHTARIFPNDNPTPEDRTWLGQTTFYTAAPGHLEARMIACAGAAAECGWMGEEVDDIFWQDPDMMSPTDWQMAGCEPGEVDDLLCEAIYKVGPLVSRGGPLWGDLMHRARLLIRSAREPA
jgi:hypothetical protein